MSDKIKVVYIGKKDEIKLSRGLTYFIFQKGVPTAVDEQYGYELLKHKTEFATPENAEELIKAREEADAKQKKLAEEQKKLLEQKEAEDSYRVFIDGEIKDISKLTRAKLATIVLAEELKIDTDKPEMKEGETQVEALRNRVREALHDKNGNPDLLQEA